MVLAASVGGDKIPVAGNRLGFLTGIRVLDFNQILAGPMAAMHLGDLGAEVIKIERPGSGDILRGYEPRVGGTSAQFAVFNRNKRSVTLDLSTERGRALCFELLETADVVLENFKAGSAETLGIGYESVKEVNPGVVYCSVKGYARESVYEAMPAFDMVVQAMSGAMSVTGIAESSPTYIGVPVGDIAPAMYAVEAILASLFARERGVIEGEFIEVPMLDSMLEWMGIRASESWVRDEPVERTGNTHERVAPYKVFETADGYLAVCVASDGMWPKFCAAIDRPDLETDSRFAGLNDRAVNQAALYEVLDDVLVTKTTPEWFGIFRDYGVPAAPVYDTQQVRRDPYVTEQQLVETVRTGGADGGIPIVRYPVNCVAVPHESRVDPPALGGSTADYLQELGYTGGEIDELRRDGIV